MNCICNFDGQHTVPDPDCKAVQHRPIPADKVCVNCAHSRAPNEEVQANAAYVLCKKGPPSVTVQPAPSSIVGQAPRAVIVNRWPAMALDDECDAFVHKAG